MENSLTSFKGNIATNSGGALFAEDNCYIKLMQYSTVIFNFNIAEMFGGSVGLYHNSNITVAGNSRSLALFERNQALFGGAIYLERKCDFIIIGKPVVLFKSNQATVGAAVYAIKNADITFKVNLW